MVQRRRAVERALARHQGESGILLDVRWPVTFRPAGATTELVRCDTQQHGLLQPHHTLARTRFDRRRPTLLALPSGDYVLDLSSEGRGHRRDTVTMAVHVRKAPPIVLTCLPAKRRFVTGGRDRTEWSLEPAPGPR